MTPPTQALATPVIRPALLHAAHQIRPHDRTPSQAPTTSRVLVLDGDDERQGILADIVTRAGGETELANTGADALDLLREDDLDALLVGGLPDGSRRGFVAWARPRFPDLAIVAIAFDAAEATDLYNAGADIVTTMPLDPDLLGAKLAAALRRARRPQLRLVGSG
jgi:DNA-binding response OmpR family regulator